MCNTLLWLCAMQGKEMSDIVFTHDIKTEGEDLKVKRQQSSPGQRRLCEARAGQKGSIGKV